MKEDATPYTVPGERGRWRGLVLAAVVHAALFLMLWIGVNWQSDTPGTIEAEVWSPREELAAPRPEPKPEPVPAREEPKPEPPPPTPPPEAKPEPKQELKPDIALEQEKKRKEEEAKRKAEEERKRKAEEEEKRRQDEARKEEERKKAEAEKKRKEKEALRRAEEERKRKAAEAEAEAAREQARQEELRRLSETAGTGGTGTAARSRGSTDASYAGKIRALIISNTVFNVPPTLVDNPAVEYAIELLPDGSLRSPPRKLKSSGVPGFDEAVLRAIEKSQPFPPDKQGVVPSSLTISHRPKDQ